MIIEINLSQLGYRTVNARKYETKIICINSGKIATQNWKSAEFPCNDEFTVIIYFFASIDS